MFVLKEWIAENESVRIHVTELPRIPWNCFLCTPSQYGNGERSKTSCWRRRPGRRQLNTQFEEQSHTEGKESKIKSWTWSLGSSNLEAEILLPLGSPRLLDAVREALRTTRSAMSLGIGFTKEWVCRLFCESYIISGLSVVNGQVKGCIFP